MLQTGSRPGADRQRLNQHPQAPTVEPDRLLAVVPGDVALDRFPPFSDQSAEGSEFPSSVPYSFE